MTLQEFCELHPNVMQYEKAGVGGVDLSLLHAKIEQSRFLRSRQSFVFFVKNYSKIVRGDYDDFKDMAEEKEERRRRLIKDKIYNLQAMENKLSVSYKTDMKEETGIEITDAIEALRFALLNPHLERNALDYYKRITTFYTTHHE